jgi:hypothetical protein
MRRPGGSKPIRVRADDWPATSSACRDPADHAHHEFILRGNSEKITRLGKIVAYGLRDLMIFEFEGLRASEFFVWLRSGAGVS